LALDAGVPILPVTINGTINVHRSGDSRVNKNQTVRVVVHEPIDTREYSRPQLKQLMERVRQSISSALEPPPASD